MSTPGSELKKDDFLNQIWTVSTTLTEEAMTVAAAKCRELGFDEYRGIVSLDESFNNLSAVRTVLEDAIEKQKLIQLPITVQREILLLVQNISKSLQGLSSGIDEVVNLTTAIELLNTSVWKYGLHNLSDQVLGYQKKLNQLKNQELQITKSISELKKAQIAAIQAVSSASEVEQKRNEVLAFLKQVEDAAQGSKTLLEQITDAGNKSNAIFVAVQQNEKQSGELTSSIKTASNELSSLDASVRKFYGEVDEYRRKIAQASEQASEVTTTSESLIKKQIDESAQKTTEAIGALQVAANATAAELKEKIAAEVANSSTLISDLTKNSKTESENLQSKVGIELDGAIKASGQQVSKLLTEAQLKLSELENQLALKSQQTIESNQVKTDMLIGELVKLKDQVREQIQQATGFRLFGAFQSRQNQISQSKVIWAYAIAALVLISAGVTIWIAHEAQLYNARDLAFWVKLSLTVPLGFALTFCTVQYSRERRLEEEYAFKSSISVSLEPYRDLVHSILEKDGTVDKSKYTEFVIDSVKNVFTPPMDRVFDTEKKSGTTEKALKHTAELVGTVLKAAKPS